MNLSDIAELVYEKPSTLFIGAGFSMDSGGPGGYRLITELRHNFGDSKESNFFNYLEEIIGIDSDKRKEVEKYIRDYLIKLRPNEEQKYLLSIPWRAVLTTNYDHIPNRIEISIDRNREIECIIDETKEGPYIDREDKLYCFKLFGDMNKEWPEEGHMVFTRSDRRIAMFRIIKFCNFAQDLMMTSNIIYIGYSFKDDLIFDLLTEIRLSQKKVPWKGYAILPNEPSKEINDKMLRYGIEWVKGDVKGFVSKLEKFFTNIPISYAPLKKTLILDNIRIDVSKQTQYNVRNHLEYMHNELLEPVSEDPRYFLEGKDHTFYPFIRDWDYKRDLTPTFIRKGKKIGQFSINSSFFAPHRQTNSSSNDNVKIALIGNAGSGKSTVAKRIAYEWYDKGHPVIILKSKGFKFSRRAIEGFIEELNINFTRRTKDSIKGERKVFRYLIIADNLSGQISEIFYMVDYLTSKEILLDLLVVDRRSNLTQEKIDELDFDAIYDISDTLYSEDLTEFNKYMDKLKLNIPKEIIKRNIENSRINKSFFALMYSTIREVQKPLRDIIIDEYGSLGPDEKGVYELVSLLDALDTKLHINLISKYTSVPIQWLFDQLDKGRLSGILQLDVNKDIFTNHKIISEIIDISVFTSSERYFNVLYNIIDLFTTGNRTEEDFVHNMLIRKIKSHEHDTRITPRKTIELYERALEKIPTRPLYHHLARNYLHTLNYEKGIEAIKKAYKVWHRHFHEGDKNLMDTEGRLELLKAGDLLDSGVDKYIVWNYLDRAENLFFAARSDVRSSPEPIQGMARTYHLKARASDEYPIKCNFCLLALGRLNYIDKNVEQSAARSLRLRRRIIAELGKEFNLDYARRILEIHGNPDGFSYLAEIEMRKKNYKKVNQLVDEGLKHKNTIWLLRIKIKVLQILYQDIKLLDDLLERYIRLGEYDLELSFESAKYYFRLGNFRRSFITFDELHRKSRGYKSGYKFSTDNVLYEGNNMKSFRGVMREIPYVRHSGKIKCNDLSEYSETIPVKYDRIKYDNFLENDKVYFNIYFTFAGPQAMGVIIR